RSARRQVHPRRGRGPRSRAQRPRRGDARRPRAARAWHGDLRRPLHRSEAQDVASLRATRSGERMRLHMSRRGFVRTALGALGAAATPGGARAAAPDLTLSDGAAEEKFDFEAQGVERWTVVGGTWAVEDMAGAPSGKRALVQRATGNEFNVIV